MDFHLSTDDLEFKQLARDFAQKRLYPNGEKFDEHQAIPNEIIKEAAEIGYFGFTIPEAYGGLGLSVSSFMGVVEELSGGSASFGMLLTCHASQTASAVNRFGSDELKKKYLPSLASGDTIGAYCLAEQNSGTDFGSLETSAIDKGDRFVLNGTKSYVTNGGIAQVLIVFAKTGNAGISCFIVDKNSNGISVGAPENKCGVKAADTRSITFANVSIPKSNLVGNLGEGLKIATDILDSGRIAVAFQAIGIAQAALCEAAKYSQIRRQFNQPIANFQAIQFKLSDMSTRIEAGRLLAYRAAQMRDENKSCHREASMAKLFCAESANYVCDQAVQIHGGYGYIKEYAVERYFRDARVTEIIEGTAEAQRIIISADILREHKIA